MQDLDAIMADRPQETPVEQQPEPRNDGRDEQGRFAPKAPEQQAQPPEQQQEPPQEPADRQAPPPGFIPQQAFDARMAKAEEKWLEKYSNLEGQLSAAMRQLQGFQQGQRPQPEAPQPPDFFENPDAAFKARMEESINPLKQSQQEIVENFSRMMATDKFGDEAVSKAEAELKTRVNANPHGMRAVYMRIMNSPHPYGELVRWHKETAALSTYGDDPEAYIKAEVDRRIAAMGGQQQPPAQQTPAVMPSQFAGARNAGPNTAPVWSGPRPLSDIKPN
jgi:hypothetical protein